MAERIENPDRISLSALRTEPGTAVSGRSRLEPADYIEELFRSGFHGKRALSTDLRKRLLAAYIDRVIDRDSGELGYQPRNPAALKRWMRACAAAVSTTASWEKILDAAAVGQADTPARSTVIPHRDVPERLWMLDELPAWGFTGSELGRVGSSPKHHLADPVLVISLLAISRSTFTGGRQLCGPLDQENGALLGRLFE